jgi:hypothetical protein
MTGVNIERQGASPPLVDMFASVLGMDTDALDVSLVGGTLVLRGTVSSYDQKVLVQRAARLAGYTRIENELRVTPGVLP